MSLGWEKIKTPFVTLVGAFTPRNRVPTVPEKQIDKIVGQKLRSASLSGASGL